MADKTKAELQAELDEANAKIKQLGSESPISDFSAGRIALLESNLQKANEEVKRLSAEPGEFEKLNEKHYELVERAAKQEEELTVTREKLATAESLLLQKEKDLSDAQAIIEEQHKALSTEETHSEGVIVTIGKKKYKVVAPAFNVGGVNYAAADLKENKELAAKLVEKGSSVLQLLS